MNLVFDGDPRGAVGAARQVASSLTKVKAEERQLAGAMTATTRETRAQAAATSHATREIEGFTRGAIAGSGALGRFARGAAFLSAGFLGGAGLTAAFRGAFGELEAGIRASAQTEAALKSTGAVAGVTAASIDALAQSQMRLSGVDDELIKQGENWLLTFRQVRNEAGKGNDIFDQATKATLNLAVAQANAHGTAVDMASSANLVGKALNDPIRGMTALQRVGVTFDNQQRAQIKRFMEQGDIMGAQKVILRELENEVGRSAKAYGDSLPGAIARARETVRNLSASLLQGLNPAIQDGADRLTAWAAEQEKSGDLQRKFNTVIQDGEGFVRGIVGVIRDVAPIVKEAADAVGGWKNAMELLIGLKVASMLAGWAGPLRALIGASAAEGAAATGLLGAAGAAAALRKRLLGINGLVIKYTIVQQIIKQLIPGHGSMGLDFSDPTTGDTEVTATYKGKTYRAVKGTGEGDALEAINAGQKLTAANLAALNALGAQTVTAKATAGSMQLPTSFAATHDTMGADWVGRTPGPDAIDLMAKPGVAVRAPEDGELTRISGHDPSEAPPLGVGGPWGRSFYYVGGSGTVYFGTHLSDVAPLGRYKKGDIIAIIGDYPGLAADHIHWAIVGTGKAAVAEANFASTQTSTLARPRSTGGGALTVYTPHDPNALKTPPGKKPKVDLTAIPDALRLKIAQASGTATLLDDITTAGEAVDYLTARLNRTTKVGVKADLQEAINGYQDAIKSAEETLARNAADAAKRAKAAHDKAVKAAREAAARLSEESGIGREFAAGKRTIMEAFKLDLLPVSEETKLKGQMSKFAALVRRAERDGKISPAELKAIKASWQSMSSGIGEATSAITANLQRSAATKWAGVTATIGRSISEQWAGTTERFNRATTAGLKSISDRGAIDIENMARAFQAKMTAFGRETDLGVKGITDRAAADVEQMSREFQTTMTVFGRETDAGVKAIARRAAADVQAMAREFETTMRDFGRETDRIVKETITDPADQAVESLSRSFQRSMDAFNRETQAGLKALEVLQTPAEAEAARRQAEKDASDQVTRIADLTKARDDAVAAEASAQNDLSGIGRRGAESIAAYNARIQTAQDAATKATADRVAAEKALREELTGDELKALQERASVERKAADEQTTVAQDAYQSQRNDLAQGLQDQETILEKTRRVEAASQELAFRDQRAVLEQSLQDEQTAREAARQATADADALAYTDQRAAEATALQDAETVREKARQATADADVQAYQDARAALEQAMRDEETTRETARQAQADAEAQAYQDRRDAQWTHLSDMHDDQTTKLNEDLDQWGTWIGNKQRSYADFLAWLGRNPVANALGGLNVIEPFSSSVGSLTAAQAGRSWAAAAGVRMTRFAGGGRVPGVGVGDTVMARVTPGERVLTGEQQRWLESVAGGQGASGRPIVFQIDGHEFARLTAIPMRAEQARIISYRSQRD